MSRARDRVRGLDWKKSTSSQVFFLSQEKGGWTYTTSMAGLPGPGRVAPPDSSRRAAEAREGIEFFFAYKKRKKNWGLPSQY